jgi:hypothetical protein
MFDFYMSGMLDYDDDLNILRKNSQYSDLIDDSIGFDYDYSDSRLSELRDKYHLDNIAGNGNDFHKLMRITLWLSKTLNLGNAKITHSFHSLEVLENSKCGFSSNCFIAATVLQECFLAMGYKTRMVRCMPIDLRFNECHCMTIAYVNEFKKFVVFDSAMGGIYIDEKGMPLSINEMRHRIIDEKVIKIRSLFVTENNNLFYKYLAKNIIRFQSHKNIKYGNEISGKKSDIMVNLNPLTLPLKNKVLIYDNCKIQHIFVYNNDKFWDL